jgi:arylsulfatase A-like enzyme
MGAIPATSPRREGLIANHKEQPLSTTDLLLVALWWGLLTGLGEGWLASSYVWHDLARAGVETEPLLFAATGLLAAVFTCGAHVTRSGAARLTFLFSALSLFALISRGVAALVAPLAVLSAIAGASILSLAWYVAGPVLLRWQKRSLPVLLLLALWCAFGFPIKQQRHEERELARLHTAPAGQPNVLVIVVDALRADHLSTYGYRRDTSPHLSELAAQGTLFENAIAPSSWTLPVHASLLTGLNPDEHHVDSDGSLLGWHLRTLSEEFMARGYRTAAFSANTFLFCRQRGFGRGFIHFEDDFQTWGGSFAESFYGDLIKHLLFRLQLKRDLFGRRRAADINGHALRWIDRGGPPFFVFLNYLDVHDPYRPLEPYQHRYTAMKHPGSRASEHWEWFEHLTPEQRQGALDAYDGAINYVDDQLRGLMQQLKERGLDRNTMVVITSDHGESFGEHGLMTHGSALYRELIHVPLVLWRPGAIPADRRVEEPVSLTELPATLLEQAGEHDHPHFPQRSLARFWTGTAGENDKPGVISQLAQLPWNPRFPNYDGPMQSITTPQWHYIHGGKFRDELFACCDSRPEQPNLADTVRGQNVISQLKQQMMSAAEADKPLAHTF